MSSRTITWSVAVTALALFAAVPTAFADFAMVSQNLTINRDHVADFSITFNQRPNFNTLDQYGRPEDSFQYNFIGDYQPSNNYQFPNNLTAIVRGDEIHFGDGIRIRNPNGDGGPDSGGWGPIITSTPFRLIGNTLKFSVPAADLGYTGGYYQYEVFSLEFGNTTADQTVTVIPLPSAFYSGLIGLALASLVALSMRRKTKLA